MSSSAYYIQYGTSGKILINLYNNSSGSFVRTLTFNRFSSGGIQWKPASFYDGNWYSLNVEPSFEINESTLTTKFNKCTLRTRIGDADATYTVYPSSDWIQYDFNGRTQKCKYFSWEQKSTTAGSYRCVLLAGDMYVYPHWEVRVFIRESQTTIPYTTTPGS